MANNFFIRVSICTLLWIFTIGAQADSQPRWLTDEIYKSVVPGAIYAGPLTGDPPVAAIYGAGEQLGYAFETSAIVDVLGFTGASFSIVVGLQVSGDISGVAVVEHTEPILDYDDNVDQIDNFVGQYTTINYADQVRLTSGGQSGEIDGITGATISARAFNYAIVQSARSVAQSLGLKSGERSKAMVDALHFESLSWLELIEAGAIQAFTIKAKMGVEPNSGNQEENPSELFILVRSRWTSVFIVWTVR